MKKGQILVTNCENFSDLSHVFFKKQARDKSLADNTLKNVNLFIQLKAFQTQTATPIPINESATQNIQNQMLNQQLLTIHSQGNQKEVTVQSIKEDILNIHNYLPQEIIEKAKNQEQLAEENEKEKEQNEMALDTSYLNLMQREFFCEICQRQYKNKKTYNSHIQTKHNETKPFLCVICQRSFKRPDYLQKHKESHKEDKEFPCNKCNQTFKFKHIHEKHIKTVHKKIIYEACQCCNKEFTQMDYVKMHLQRGQQNYKCNHQECGEKFSSKQLMERHNITMHQG